MSRALYSFDRSQVSILHAPASSNETRNPQISSPPLEKSHCSSTSHGRREIRIKCKSDSLESLSPCQISSKADQLPPISPWSLYRKAEYLCLGDDRTH